MIRKFLMHLSMLRVKYLYFRPLVKDARKPLRAQVRVLKRILKNNSQTSFGKDFGFDSIKSTRDFMKRVPIQKYEDLLPYIERQIETGELAIVPEKPIMYAQTSGTLGKPKYIPVRESTVCAYKRAQRIFSYAQYSAIPGVYSGKILAIVSSPIEGYLDNGTPYGSMSGLVYQNMPTAVRWQYVLPQEIFAIDDYDTKYKLIAAFALSEKNVSVLASANPSTLLKIAEVIENEFDLLVNCVATGHFDALAISISEEQIAKLKEQFLSNPERAQELKTLKESQGFLLFRDLWPNLKAIGTWTSGNCNLLVPRLRDQICPHTRIVEMGYVSSEFRGTITMDCEKMLGVPTLQDNFFEFAPVQAFDNGKTDTLLISELQEGEEYYIIATTPDGLYRYFINDVVRVTGRFENTPTLAFVQKGKGVTSLTGEKLYENQVMTAVQQVCEAQELEPLFFMMLADQYKSSYELYLETNTEFDTSDFAKQFNRALGEVNIEYKAKFKSGRLRFCGVKRLQIGTYENYKIARVEAGQREGQFKALHLQYRSSEKFPFEEHVL